MLAFLAGVYLFDNYLNTEMQQGGQHVLLGVLSIWLLRGDVLSVCTAGEG